MYEILIEVIVNYKVVNNLIGVKTQTSKSKVNSAHFLRQKEGISLNVVWGSLVVLIDRLDLNLNTLTIDSRLDGRYTQLKVIKQSQPKPNVGRAMLDRVSIIVGCGQLRT